MRDARLGALVLALAAPLTAVAQGFPGEAPRPPAFPATVSLYLLGTWAGNRMDRLYDVGFPNPNDPGCDTLQCRTTHGFAGAGGVGARIQVPVTPRVGLRFALQYAAPKPRIATSRGTVVRVDEDRVSSVRGE